MSGVFGFLRRDLRATLALAWLALLVIVQGIGGRLTLMHQTLFAVMLCGTITVFLSPLLPAESNYVFLNLGAGDFQNIRPVIGFTSPSRS